MAEVAPEEVGLEEAVAAEAWVARVASWVSVLLAVTGYSIQHIQHNS